MLASQITNWRSWRRENPTSTVMVVTRDGSCWDLDLGLDAVAVLLGLLAAVRIHRSTANLFRNG